MSTTQNPRATEVSAQRRRRADTGELAGLKLAVPENLKDPNFEYRWLNDTVAGRLHTMTVADDWDVVKDKRIDGQGEGTVVSRFSGTSENGQPVRAVLCRKPKQFHEEDQRAKQRRLDEKEDAMRRGPPNKPGEGLEADKAYVPQGHVNVIGRQS